MSDMWSDTKIDCKITHTSVSHVHIRVLTHRSYWDDLRWGSCNENDQTQTFILNSINSEDRHHWCSWALLSQQKWKEFRCCQRSNIIKRAHTQMYTLVFTQCISAALDTDSLSSIFMCDAVNRTKYLLFNDFQTEVTSTAGWSNNKMWCHRLFMQITHNVRNIIYKIIIILSKNDVFHVCMMRAAHMTEMFNTDIKLFVGHTCTWHVTVNIAFYHYRLLC